MAFILLTQTHHLTYNKDLGDDLASTSIAKPKVHVEQAKSLVKMRCNLLDANKSSFENYDLAKAA
jgi:hypothetical protein